MLHPLYPACQLGFVPPSCSLQSVPHPVSKSSVPLALLKLPLGNLTPYTKPESACSCGRTHTRHTYKHEAKDQHMQLAVFWNVSKGVWGGGHLVFILPSPSSASRISSSSLIGDLLCRSQSPSDVAKGEWDPLLSPPPFLSCRVSIHMRDHPIHPHLGDYTIFFPCHSPLYLQLRTSVPWLQQPLLFTLSLVPADALNCCLDFINQTH